MTQQMHCFTLLQPVTLTIQGHAIMHYSTIVNLSDRPRAGRDKKINMHHPPPHIHSYSTHRLTVGLVCIGRLLRGKKNIYMEADRWPGHNCPPRAGERGGWGSAASLPHSPPYEGGGESLFPLHFSLREFGLRHFLPSSSLYTRYSVYRDTQYLYNSIYMCTLYCMYTVWIPIFLHLKYCIMLVNNWHSCLMNVIKEYLWI